MPLCLSFISLLLPLLNSLCWCCCDAAFFFPFPLCTCACACVDTPTVRAGACMRSAAPSKQFVLTPYPALSLLISTFFFLVCVCVCGGEGIQRREARVCQHLRARVRWSILYRAFTGASRSFFLFWFSQALSFSLFRVRCVIPSTASVFCVVFFFVFSCVGAVPPSARSLLCTHRQRPHAILPSPPSPFPLASNAVPLCPPCPSLSLFLLCVLLADVGVCSLLCCPPSFFISDSR